MQLAPNVSSRIEKFGLFLLNPETSHYDSVEVEETLLDIVALHVITRDAYDT